MRCGARCSTLVVVSYRPADLSQALQVFEHTVEEAAQTVLWTLVSPYFQLMNGAEYPSDHIPDLNGGVGAIEEAFQHHIDTLLFPNVGAAYELFQASQVPFNAARLWLWLWLALAPWPWPWLWF